MLPRFKGGSAGIEQFGNLHFSRGRTEPLGDEGRDRIGRLRKLLGLPLVLLAVEDLEFGSIEKRHNQPSRNWALASQAE